MACGTIIIIIIIWYIQQMSEAEHAHANRPLDSTDYQVVFQLMRLQQCACVSMYKAQTRMKSHTYLYIYIYTKSHETEWNRDSQFTTLAFQRSIAFSLISETRKTT